MKSVHRVMEALAHFSEVTSMIADMDKSSKFLAGVYDRTKKMFKKNRLCVGIFPIRHLGLPLSPKKWRKLDCHVLMEKITQRIRVSYSKHLSYTGRLQVINAVSFSIHSFWEVLFILPKAY